MPRDLPILLLLLLATGTATAQVPVPDKGAYHSAFVDTRGFPSTVDAYEGFGELSGRRVAIAMLYRSWSMYPRLDLLTMYDLRDAGMIPHITWEPWWGNRTDQTYSNQKIIDGAFDTYIDLWAEDIKAFGSPVMIRWAHEMNGDWYPWSGIRSGGATLDGFGDPERADGPERYIAAYRYIHGRFAEAGVTNVDWIWCPNNGSAPDQPWNQPEQYYPGDDVVDWVCIDGYNWGAATYDWGISGWASFVQLFKPMYDRLKSYGKPVMIGEFASAEVGGDKGQWISEAYAAMRSPAFALVKAITWFHINKETDWRINSSERALGAYRQALAHEHFLESAVTTSAESLPDPAAFQIQIYPQPARESLTIRVATDRSSAYSAEIYDLLGRKAMDFDLGRLDAGATDVRLDRLPAAAGTYLVRVVDGARRTAAQHALVIY